MGIGNLEAAKQSVWLPMTIKRGNGGDAGNEGDDTARAKRQSPGRHCEPQHGYRQCCNNCGEAIRSSLKGTLRLLRTSQ